MVFRSTPCGLAIGSSKYCARFHEFLRQRVQRRRFARLILYWTSLKLVNRFLTVIKFLRPEHERNWRRCKYSEFKALRHLS
jgi:hypothetical protein